MVGIPVGSGKNGKRLERKENQTNPAGNSSPFPVSRIFPGNSPCISQCLQQPWDKYPGPRRWNARGLIWGGMELSRNFITSGMVARSCPFPIPAQPKF